MMGFVGDGFGCKHRATHLLVEEMKAPPVALPRLQSERLQIKQNSSKICLADDRTHCKVLTSVLILLAFFRSAEGADFDQGMLLMRG